MSGHAPSQLTWKVLRKNSAVRLMAWRSPPSTRTPMTTRASMHLSGSCACIWGLEFGFRVYLILGLSKSTALSALRASSSWVAKMARLSVPYADSADAHSSIVDRSQQGVKASCGWSLVSERQAKQIGTRRVDCRPAAPSHRRRRRAPAGLSGCQRGWCPSCLHTTKASTPVEPPSASTGC